MTVREAMLALKTHNPNMTLNPRKLQLEGFAHDLLTSLTATQMASQTKGGEDIDMFFTSAPSPEVLWGIARSTNYANQERPSLDNTLAALRNKYGPETFRDGANQNGALVWAFDAQRRPLGIAQARRNWQLCVNLTEARFTPGQAISDLTSSPQPPPECDSATLTIASIQDNLLNPGRPERVVNALIVKIIDAPMRKAAMDATRAAAIAAGKARANKEADEMKKRGGPKM